MRARSVHKRRAADEGQRICGSKARGRFGVASGEVTQPLVLTHPVWSRSGERDQTRRILHGEADGWGRTERCEFPVRIGEDLADDQLLSRFQSRGDRMIADLRHGRAEIGTEMRCHQQERGGEPEGGADHKHFIKPESKAAIRIASRVTLALGH